MGNIFDNAYIPHIYYVLYIRKYVHRTNGSHHVLDTIDQASQISKKFRSLCNISYLLRVKVIYCTVYTINCEILESRYLFFGYEIPGFRYPKTRYEKCFLWNSYQYEGVCVCMYMCVGVHVGEGGRVLIVLSSASEGNVKIASGGISCKCNVWWIFLISVFTCTILPVG